MAIVETDAPASTGNVLLLHPPEIDLSPAHDAFLQAGVLTRAAALPTETVDADGRAVVFLIESARIAAIGNREQVAIGLELIARAHHAAVVVLAETNDPRGWIATDPHVDGWLVAPIDPHAALATVMLAARCARERERVRMLEEERRVGKRESRQLLRIGVALSSERDIGELQKLIVNAARQLTNADSGSLFLLEEIDGERKLRFAVAQTGPKDAGTYLGAVLPLTRGSISGYVATTGETIRLDDAYEIAPSAEYQFNPSFDMRTNYRTMSVLAVPMRDHKDEVVGVIMLINRKDDFDLVLESPEHTLEVVRPFTAHDENVLLSLASQAGVAVENKTLLYAIQDLFEQFVRASVKAIEVRDRATQGHSSRVAELTVAQATAVNEIDAGIYRDMRFDVDQLREMRYAALLHDFGKVAVPEYIFAKAKKLPEGRLDEIRLRFLLALEQMERDAAHRKFALVKAGIDTSDERFLAIDAALAIRRTDLNELLESVESANEPRVIAEGVGEALDVALQRTYSHRGEAHTLLKPEEYDFLRIARGSLSTDERKKMEQHVTQSFLFLREIPWTQTPWKRVADLAYGHHEHLDGTGYPRGLMGTDIAPQVRMLTIADVFDALTANDRPYKAAMPIERALDILVKEFAQRGKVDPDLLDIFITKKVYEPVMQYAQIHTP